MRYRVVNIVIYNDAHEHERSMKLELVRLARRTRDVKSLFVSLSPWCSVAHERDGVLHVPGNESFVPGILHKTMEAFAYCARHFEFDFVVRSNISTVIDFPRLPIHELTDPVVYASAYVWNKEDRANAFASGTNIILNRAAVEFLLAYRDRLDHGVIDDVAIYRALTTVAAPRQLSTEMVWNGEDRAGVVFRSRSDDRADDVARMRRIVDRIIQDREDRADLKDPESLVPAAHSVIGVLAVIVVLAVLAVLGSRVFRKENGKLFS
jgi:hypothetical protein